MVKSYLSFFVIEFQQGLKHKGAALGRFAFYGTILFVFAQLWKVVAAKSNLSMGPKEMLWYLAMTELVILSMPLTHVEIEEDVKTGNLAYSIIRPVNYLWARYFRALGSAFSRFSFLVFAGVFFAYLFTGGFPQNIEGLFMFLPLCLLSIAVSIVFQLAIGVSSFWIQDCSPVYWVWQKMSFILGGMILPLDIYPEWLKNIAMVTPFSSLIYEPAKAAITGDGQMALMAACKMILWWVLGMMGTYLIFLKARRGLELNGG